jgi:hypothetical protein
VLLRSSLWNINKYKLAGMVVLLNSHPYPSIYSFTINVFLPKVNLCLESVQYIVEFSIEALQQRKRSGGSLSEQLEYVLLNNGLWSMPVMLSSHEQRILCAFFHK